MAQQVVKPEIVCVSDDTSDGTEAEEEKELLHPCPYEPQDRPGPSIDLECPTVSASPRDVHVELPATSQDSTMEFPAGNVSFISVSCCFSKSCI